MSAPAPVWFDTRGGGGGKTSAAFSPVVVTVISILGSAFLVVSYYRIFSKICSRWMQQRAGDRDLESQLNSGDTDANASPLPAHGLDEELIKKIPIFEYKSGDGFTVDTECPVCLMEFVDKQELRILPKCAHAFHVSCIDTWLSTRSTCPCCRANIFTEQVMSQYPPPLSPPMSFLGTPQDGGFSPVDYSMSDFARFNNGIRRSPATTLRGLLSFEDQQQNYPPWVPNGSESGRADEPGEDSLRLYNSRDYGGDSSSRHHALVIPMSGSLPSAPPSADPQQSDVVTRTTSFKEGLQRSSSRDRENRWSNHPSARRSRRNRLTHLRSFSMGTSRRLANALEFLDLEGLRSSSSHGKGAGDKLYSAYEYGITETPDYHHPLAGQAPILTVSPADYASPTPDGRRDRESIETRAIGGGSSSSETKESHIRSLTNLVDANNRPSGGDAVDSSGAAMKSSSGRVKGRSLSFSSPFSLRRSLSGGRSIFSFKPVGRSNRISSTPSASPHS